MTHLQQYWTDVVTVALLGTDRREPPAPPQGGLADLAADAALGTPSQRLLQQVAACTVVRRAGIVPGPAASMVAPPDADVRPLTPPSATTTWRRVVDDWPVLEDEWVLAVVQSGRRLSPELVPTLLARHRSDPVRHARVLVAAGPLGTWMIDWSPRLACTVARRASAESIAELPELAVTPDLAALLTAPPREAATVIAGGLAEGRFLTSHRAVLVNLVARLAPSSLAEVATALGRVNPSSPAIGLAFTLGDLARLRLHMLTELEPV